jgi:A/G-specific adenine glycosylase
MFSPFPYPQLISWYAKNGRHDLPWRKTHDPYRVWLSEILLQQTQAPRVVAFFNRIIERYPTVDSLAGATFEEFFPYYDGLGYYSRARNLLATAKIVANEMGGIFPAETAELVRLPGIGPYTAEAIRAFAFDLPTLSFDTNLEKVFSRYYF